MGKIDIEDLKRELGAEKTLDILEKLQLRSKKRAVELALREEFDYSEDEITELMNDQEALSVIVEVVSHLNSFSNYEE